MVVNTFSNSNSFYDPKQLIRLGSLNYYKTRKPSWLHWNCSNSLVFGCLYFIFHKIKSSQIINGRVTMSLYHQCLFWIWPFKRYLDCFCLFQIPLSYWLASWQLGLLTRALRYICATVCKILYFVQKQLLLSFFFFKKTLYEQFVILFFCVSNRKKVLKHVNDANHK